MRHLSKNKLLAFRQCPKRLWLEIHRSDLRDDSDDTEAGFAIGHSVGDIARRLYNTDGDGVLIDLEREGFDNAFKHTTELLKTPQPIFEAGFAAGGALAMADVMLPAKTRNRLQWKIIEVKSSTSVKDYHRDDAAVQAFVARQAGVALASIAVAHIDSQWVYPGEGQYQGLLKESDVTKESFSRSNEVKSWISEAQKIVAGRNEPSIRTGSHCSNPYACGFFEYCSSQEPAAEHPIDYLPRIQSKALKAYIADNSVIDMRDVPKELLNATQQLVRRQTLSGKVYFDANGAADDLKAHRLPAYFLDFETVQFAAPIWKGTRPYQQIPFQFSLHRLSKTEKLEVSASLDLSGCDPSKPFAKALIAACGERGPIFVYNAGFESTRIGELAKRFPSLERPLQAINARLVDLHPIARSRYYHPSQKGSWSIKAVLRAVDPALSHDKLDDVQDGGMAMNAYLEAIDASTTPTRKIEIERQLRDYCHLDTLAMVRLWQHFTGRTELHL